MVVRRIIIGSAAEYEKWVSLKKSVWGKCLRNRILRFNQCFLNQRFPKGRRGIPLFVFTALYYFYAPFYHF